MQCQEGLEARVPGKVLCNQTALACLERLPQENNSEVYMSQHLYTIYVHTKPDFHGYPEGSPFYHRVVPRPIQV